MGQFGPPQSIKFSGMMKKKKISSNHKTGTEKPRRRGLVQIQHLQFINTFDDTLMTMQI